MRLKKIVRLYEKEALSVLREMEDEFVDLIVTDPPYDISVRNGGGSINNVKGMRDSLKGIVDANIADGYDIEEFGAEFVRVTKGINIYLWCNKKQIPEYFDFYVGRHKCLFDILCWHKTNALPTYHGKYLSDTEYLLYFHSKGKCSPEGYDDAKTWYASPLNQVDKKKYGHPTVKPLEVIEKLVRNSSKRGELVLDPFMGSGTTGVACVNNGRRFIGIEYNGEFFETSVDRIKTESSCGVRIVRC